MKEHNDEFLHISKKVVTIVGLAILLLISTIVMFEKNYHYPILPDAKCDVYCIEHGYEMGYFTEHSWQTGLKTLDGTPAYCFCGNNKDTEPTGVEVNFNETCDNWWWCK